MGMSTHIVAFIPDTDPEFQRHKKILLACKEGNVSLPVETFEYFGYEMPEEYLLEDKLTVNLERGKHYEDYIENDSRVFEVDLSKLPKGVSKIRFYNNW